MQTYRRFLALSLLIVIAILALNCAPGNERWDQDLHPGHLAGFWVGIWHGLIIIVTFIVSLFTKEVGIYEVHNTGWPYNLGFLIGLVFSVGGGLRMGAKRSTKPWRRRRRDWDEIGEKIEERVRRGIKTWLDEMESEEKKKEWEEIATKIEEKIREAMKKWVEER